MSVASIFVLGTCYTHLQYDARHTNTLTMHLCPPLPILLNSGHSPQVPFIQTRGTRLGQDGGQHKEGGEGGEA